MNTEDGHGHVLFWVYRQMKSMFVETQVQSLYCRAFVLQQETHLYKMSMSDSSLSP